MKMKIAAVFIPAFLLGIIFTAVTVHIGSARMFVLEVKSPYDFEKTVETLSERIQAKQGWKLVSIIDQQKAITDGGAENPGKVSIIELCNSQFSSKMLATDERKRMAVNMPVRISVYEKSTGEVYLGLSNGYLMSKIYGGETEKIIELVSRDMEDILSFVNFKYNAF